MTRLTELSIPPDLQMPGDLAWNSICAAMPGLEVGQSSVWGVFRHVCAVSRVVSEFCQRRPQEFMELLGSGRMERPVGLAEFSDELAARLAAATTDAETKQILRCFRNREMVRIAFRDIAGLAPLVETLRELSELAEACIRTSLDHLFAKACELRGTPLNRHGQPQSLVVLGMGKLGAKELNYSSDIDLIFAFEDDGVLSDRKETSYSEFYTRLARSLVSALDEMTADGFVFRVDTRLRPFGDSGALVLSFDAMEAYYQSQAREWERYAMVKARAVGGNAQAGATLEKMLRPFVYRRYLDYRAFGELRDLKQKITAELVKKDRMDNVKLGPGGIREIEFIGQAFQLIRGGQQKQLQERGILRVLDVLAELNQLPADVVFRLKDAYEFLRLVENRIQQFADKQTHDLPKDTEPRLSLALGMRFPAWEAFKAELDRVRTGVHEIFQQVIEAPDSSQGNGQAVLWIDLDDQDLVVALDRAGVPEIDEMVAVLRPFFGIVGKRLTPKGAAELNRLLTPLFRLLAPLGNPVETLGRILKLLEAIATRTVYLTLLAENETVLIQLVKLASAGSWIAQYIANHPLLLDELLDPRRLYAPLSREQLGQELRQRMASVESGDLEQAMLVLRQFKQANVLRIAAADIMGVIPIMVVSDYLTYLAETVVAEVLDQAWRATVPRHGLPGAGDGSAVEGFGVIAYGKMGGIELSYSSDLDLVFLYGGVADDAMTKGEQPISAMQFYGRIAKRMINILTTQMLAGDLYEIDLRLRPSGNSGLLVSSLDAYDHYQLNSAWTWEQQALVRARFVAGDPRIGAAFDTIRKRALGRPRLAHDLRREVREMREKMRENLASKEADVFDLKQSPGGIADIEFIVQFGTLANAHQHPQLLRWTDVVRLLETLESIGFLVGDEAKSLKSAYCQFREHVHQAALLEAPPLVSISEFELQRKLVLAAWRRIME